MRDIIWGCKDKHNVCIFRNIPAYIIYNNVSKFEIIVQTFQLIIVVAIG